MLWSVSGAPPGAEEILRLALASAPERQIETRLDVTPDTLKIGADPELLAQALINLLRNAIRATGDADKPLIRFAVSRQGRGQARIEIRDNGPGIPQKARDHLFEAFQGSGRPGGTGLGLVIASELARAHGGEIRLVATSSAGTEFWVMIPDRLAPLSTGRRGERQDPSAA